MTVEAAPTSDTDTALIAEIPPAMQKKLRRDSRTQMGLFGLAAIMAGGTFTSGNMPALLGEHSQAIFSFLGVLFSLAGIAIAVASFFSGNGMLREEAQYRRRHGKWRWER